MKKETGSYHFSDTGLIFGNINNTKGKVIKRYNIPLAKIEYYFIPLERFAEYDKARCMQDHKAKIRLSKEM